MVIVLALLGQDHGLAGLFMLRSFACPSIDDRLLRRMVTAMLEGNFVSRLSHPDAVTEGLLHFPGGLQAGAVQRDDRLDF